jgi:hypothetical protein
MPYRLAWLKLLVQRTPGTSISIGSIGNLMHILKHLMGSGANSDGKRNVRYLVPMEDKSQVPAVYVDAKAHPREVLSHLRLKTLPRVALFITGGASQMSDEDIRLTRLLFEQAIAPFAQDKQIVVIDGATQSGVIEMMATARRKGGYTFPLIGIAPFSRIHYPGKPKPPPSDKEEKSTYPLCVGHSHFVFVTGESYGAESEMIVNMAHVLAGGERDKAGRKVPAIGVVVNGGKITSQEAYMATSKYIDVPLVVLEGSGRFADELAEAVRTGETSQALIRSIIDRGNVQLVGTAAGANAMRQKLEIAYDTDPYDQFR